jgi:hypothetical protein
VEQLVDWQYNSHQNHSRPLKIELTHRRFEAQLEEIRPHIAVVRTAAGMIAEAAGDSTRPVVVLDAR